MRAVQLFVGPRKKIGLAFSRKKWDAFSRKRVDEEFQYFLMLAKPCI